MKEEEESRMTTGSWPGGWVGQGDMHQALRRKTWEALTLKEGQRKQSPEKKKLPKSEQRGTKKTSVCLPKNPREVECWGVKSDRHQEVPSN